MHAGPANIPRGAARPENGDNLEKGKSPTCHAWQEFDWPRVMPVLLVPLWLFEAECCAWRHVAECRSDSDGRAVRGSRI